jgi:hypothetical protein
MTERLPLLRILLTPVSPESVEGLIASRWERLHDPEPRPASWTIRAEAEGALVLSRHGDYTFDAALASDTSEPRGRSWLVELGPRLQLSAWRGGKWVDTNLDQLSKELARRGLGAVADMLQRGVGHAAVRVDGLAASAREALASELGARNGWQLGPAGDALVARGPSWAETQSWASDLVRSHPSARVTLFWRPWSGSPAVLEISRRPTRAWYPPEMTAHASSVERVDTLFGARDWDGIRAAAQIPAEWFPQVLGIE